MILPATLFRPGDCYLMVYRGRVLKFKVRAYYVKSRSYMVTKCGSGEIIELRHLEPDEMETITDFSCHLCDKKTGVLI